jgi:hypothetical protein
LSAISHSLLLLVFRCERSQFGNHNQNIPVRFEEKLLKEVEMVKGDFQTVKGDFQAFKGEVQGDVQTVKGDVDSLKKSDSHKGVTTQAQFCSRLREKQLLVPARQTDIWDEHEKWPLGEEPKQPKEGASENITKSSDESVQAIGTRILTQLRDHGGGKEKPWNSLPEPDAYKQVSFGSRKPDIVNYQKDKTGSLAITSFGDFKKRGTGNFSNDEVGHVLDMARVFMEDVMIHRKFVVVFLSDGVRWQFFRVERGSSGVLKYMEAAVISNAMDGWQRYIALLSAPMKQVGFVIPEIDGVELHEVLGRGGSAVVYRGKYKEKEVLVKVFFETRKLSFEAERNALTTLKGVAGVPRSEVCLDVMNHISLEGSYRKVIVVTPVGTPLAKHKERVKVNGRHLGECTMLAKSFTQVIEIVVVKIL